MTNHHDQIRKRHLAPLITGLLATGIASPALGQRGVEFGYKDRIFEQKYVLAPQISENEQAGAMLAVHFRLLPNPDGGPPNLPAPRVIEAMGGACRMFLSAGTGRNDLTPSQKELDAAPATPRSESQEEAKKSPEAEDEDMDCIVQTVLFEAAYADSLSTDAQLSRLARHTRQRFRNVWMSAADATDPAVQEGLRRVLSIGIRIKRLERAGVDIPASLREAMTGPEKEDFSASARQWARPERYGPVERQLAALEEEAARPLLEAKARQEQEQAALQAAEAAHKQAEAARREAEQVRNRAEAQRRDQIKTLQGMIVQQDKELEHEYAIARISRDRPPYSRHRQASIDRIQARRAELQAQLRELQGDRADQPAPAHVGMSAPAAALPPPAGPCRIGTLCPVIELTLFCRTPQQLNAILSQRPGRERKQVLTTLTASGDCRQVRAGETLVWSAPLTVIRPHGEEPAELVPGTLADGTSGFMLRDGVLPRAEAAAR
ncbi:coiled-coil domain-containing protein [Xanthobacter variabilis]|uniref:hypothetical protein n=1 Tax=Xanthobacter variabilis TaxID=3119932 RepID=UPI00372B1713